MGMINATTFVAEKPFGDRGTEEGTVELTLNGQTRRVKAYRHADGDITAYGLTGRYQTGQKAWPASVALRLAREGRPAHESIWFGRDDRVGRFHKASHLSFSA